MRKLVFSLIMAVFFITACNNSSSNNKKSVSLSAAGATFPLPFYNLAFKEYSKSTGILVTYGGIGSGGGIRSLKDQVVDFGASDAYLNEEKESDMPAPIVHIPTCIGAVVLAYNLEGVNSLKLNNELLEAIFMGKITKWNDPKISALNNGVNLPDMEITFVHRSDGSGTTYIFSDFMSKISQEWNETVGKGKSLKWPIGIGAKGNPGVAGTISSTPGSIGYIGSEFAFAQKISFADLQNASGNYIKPSIKSISAAAQGEIPDDTKVMLTNSDDPNAYPICGFTWLILYKDQNYDGRSLQQSKETLKLLQWMINKDAQEIATKVNYAPLPSKAVDKANAILKSVTYDDKPLIQ